MNDYGFYRVACAVPGTNVGDIQFNTAEIIDCIAKAIDKDDEVLVDIERYMKNLSK